MNRIDRQHLSALADSVNASSPIGLNTATGAPELNGPAFRPAATVADDVTVANSNNVIEPKPGSKFAHPEDFGTVPVGMNSHGDYIGPNLTTRTGRNEQERIQQEQIITPKPGSKFAWPEEDEFGVRPAPLPCARSEEGTSTSMADSRTEDVASRRHPDLSSHVPSQRLEQTRPAVSVPDDMSLPNNGDIIIPKPGSKFATGCIRG